MEEPTKNDYHFPARNSFWWFGVPIAIAITFFACVFIFYARNYEDRHLNQQIVEASQIISSPVSNSVENYALGIERMGKRWEAAGGISEALWIADATNYIIDNKVFRSIAITTPDLVVKWIVPESRREKYVGLDIKTLPGRVALYTEAKKSPQVTISPILKFVDGTAGFVIIKPLYINNTLNGFISAGVDVQRLFKHLLGKGLGNDYNVAIYQGGKLVYAVGKDEAMNRYRVVRFIKVMNMQWQIVVSPTAAMVNKANTELPLAISIGALLSAIFILGLFYFYQRSRELAWRALQMSEQSKKVAYRLEKIIDTVNEGFIAFDEHCRIIDWNPYAEKILGWKKDEALGKDVHELTIPKRHIEGLREAIKQILSGQQNELFNHEVEFKALRRDGREFTVEVVTVPICIDGKYTFQSFIRDITQRKKAEADQAQLASIIDASDDPIISMTTNGTILTWNNGAEHLFGYLADEIIGKQVQILYQQDEVKTVEDILEKVGKGMHITQADTVRLTKEGKYISVSDSFTPIYDKNGNVSRISSIIHDISDLKKVDKMKNEFVSIVSHELRTPLTSIRGSLGLLVSGRLGELNEKSKQLVDIAINNCERLIRLINDILDVEKIAAGKMQYYFKLLDLEELMQDAVAINQGMAVKHNVELRLESEKGLEVYVDYDRSMQMMTNLLSNAIRYSHKGGVVTIKTTVNNDHVRITVNNFGSIIPKSFREKIFGKFSQADSSNTREKGGTGLGLNITKSMVEKHGGQISYDSDEQNGTNFYITLPLASRHHAPEKELRKAVVLALGCDDELQDLLQYALGGNMSVIKVATLKEAKHALKDQKIGLIIVNNAILRQYENALWQALATQKIIPIILLIDDSNEEAVLPPSVDALLKNTLNSDIFLQKVQTLLHDKRNIHAATE